MAKTPYATFLAKSILSSESDCWPLDVGPRLAPRPCRAAAAHTCTSLHQAAAREAHTTSQRSRGAQRGRARQQMPW